MKRAGTNRRRHVDGRQRPAVVSHHRRLRRVGAHSRGAQRRGRWRLHRQADDHVVRPHGQRSERPKRRRRGSHRLLATGRHPTHRRVRPFRHPDEHGSGPRRRRGGDARAARADRRPGRGQLRHGRIRQRPAHHTRRGRSGVDRQRRRKPRRPRGSRCLALHTRQPRGRRLHDRVRHRGRHHRLFRGVGGRGDHR